MTFYPSSYSHLMNPQTSHAEETGYEWYFKTQNDHSIPTGITAAPPVDAGRGGQAPRHGGAARVDRYAGTIDSAGGKPGLGVGMRRGLVC